MACTPCPGSKHYKAPHYGYDDNDGTSRLIEALTPALSECILTITTPPSKSLPVGQPKTYVASTYKATCQLRGDSKDGCEFPDTCEDIMVTVQGVVYEVPNVVRIPPANMPYYGIGPTCERPISCPPGGKGGPCPPRQQKQGQTAAPVPVKSAAKLASSNEETVDVGTAQLYIGSFTIHGPHPLKYSTGQHQYSLFVPGYSGIAPAYISETEGFRRLPDGVHQFDFIRQTKAEY